MIQVIEYLISLINSNWSDPVWSSVIAAIIVALIFGLWKAMFKKNISDKNITSKVDEALYLKLKNDVLHEKEGGAIFFLKNGWWLGMRKLNPKWLNDFNKLAYLYKSSDFEFIDKELEELKIKLMTEIDSLLETIALHTFPDDQGFQEVPKEFQRTDPERYENTVKRLEASRKSIIKMYDLLMKSCRLKFDK